MEKERIVFENEILDRLVGKFFLLQDPSRKREVTYQMFLEVYNCPIGQCLVSKLNNLNLETIFSEFLAYGVIDEFLSDPEVEDIMINYLSPIYVHKTSVGLVKTEKSFISHEELDLLIKKLIVFSGRKAINKINNVELSEIKGRANIIYSPFNRPVAFPGISILFAFAYCI